MGIVRTAMSLFGGSKLELLRMLVADRTDGDDRVMLRTGAPWRATRLEVMGTPEATAYTIAESLNQLVDNGCSDQDAIKRIEGFRAMSGLGSVELSDNALEYGRRRVRLEHRGVGITDEQIYAALLAAECIHRNPGADPEMAYYSGKYKAKKLTVEHLASTLVMYLDGALSDDQLWDKLAPIVSEQRERQRIHASRIARAAIHRLGQ